MGNKYKTHVKHETTEFDAETGAARTTTSTQVFRSVAEPSFVKMYVDDISELNKLGRTANRLLFALVKRVGYDSVITLAPYVKREMGNEIGVKTIQSVDNSLGELKKHKLITSIGLGRGSFMLNPDYFARGQWIEIEKLRKNFRIELKITYDEHGRKVESNLLTGVKESDEEVFIEDDMGKIELS